MNYTKKNEVIFSFFLRLLRPHCMRAFCPCLCLVSQYPCVQRPLGRVQRLLNRVQRPLGRVLCSLDRVQRSLGRILSDKNQRRHLCRRWLLNYYGWGKAIRRLFDFAFLTADPNALNEIQFVG